MPTMPYGVVVQYHLLPLPLRFVEHPAAVSRNPAATTKMANNIFASASNRIPSIGGSILTVMAEVGYEPNSWKRAAVVP